MALAEWSSRGEGGVPEVQPTEAVKHGSPWRKNEIPRGSGTEGFLLETVPKLGPELQSCGSVPGGKPQRGTELPCRSSEVSAGELDGV